LNVWRGSSSGFGAETVLRCFPEGMETVCFGIGSAMILRPVVPSVTGGAIGLAGASRFVRLSDWLFRDLLVTGAFAGVIGLCWFSVFATDTD
jgi:hypothetical protein